jgi:phospholipid/cholesterol/gamma-HCH transport system ATP-binding protein
MSASDQAIRFESIAKSFDGTRVLDDVSFDVPRHTACCIMGRSGTGKSVTLKLLMGLLQPDEGKIYVNDLEIETLDSRRLVEVRKTMGFLFQYSALFDSLSVADNVAFPLRRHTRMPEREIIPCVKGWPQSDSNPNSIKCRSISPEACESELGLRELWR